VKVDIGVIIERNRKILVGKRTGSHARKYSIPGGHLDPGETFEKAAIREIKEETNLDIKSPQVIAITNNLETYNEEGMHYLSVILLVSEFSGRLRIVEPDKCERWLWVDPRRLPEPYFDASKYAVECYLKGVFYVK
jgi:8-oxo-dGTP diphosphatase